MPQIHPAYSGVPFDGARASVVLIALLTLQVGAPSQTIVHELVGTAPCSQNFGASVASLGDLNGDGADDLAIGRPEARVAGAAETGCVEVYSGIDATLLYRLVAPTPNMRFGHVVRRIGNADNDGVSDFAVGAPADSSVSARQGSVWLYSGASGALLFRWDGGAPSDWFGSSIAPVGDVDSDGRDDLIVGSPTRSANYGRFTILSGGTGAAISGQGSPLPRVDFGRTVGTAGDFDGDGVRDYLITGASDATSTFIGLAWIYSGRNLSLLRTLGGQAAGEGFGATALALGDIDGDGRGDLAFGTWVGRIDFYAGGTGRLIYSRTDLGTNLASTGDFNGDGVEEILVGGTQSVRLFDPRARSVLAPYRVQVVNQEYFGASFDGRADTQGDGVPELVIGGALATGADFVRVATWAPAGIRGSPATLSSAVGGTQALAIFPGSYYAGEAFIVLGSLSGSTPGFSFGGVDVPLSFDSYTTFTLLSPNTPLLSASAGLLNTLGQAAATFRLPPGIPGSVGMQVHHALVFVSGARILASNATAVLILP
ncbi:MAG: FG-GAP repeat protein [Planctomycetes bacterium]|nr:FG-GAP repeat protein [Planctomycetota bacterium]